MSATPWPSEWIRAVLELAVLRVLAGGPTYGYAIATALEEAGIGTVKGGTLYPLLSRLEVAGHVTVEWRAGEGGPGRKYYALTDAGLAQYRDRVERWHRFTGVVADHLADGATTHDQEEAP